MMLENYNCCLIRLREKYANKIIIIKDKTTYIVERRMRRLFRLQKNQQNEIDDKELYIKVITSHGKVIPMSKAGEIGKFGLMPESDENTIES